MNIIKKTIKIAADPINIFDIIKSKKIDFVVVTDYKWAFPYKLSLLCENKTPVDQHRMFLTESVGNKVKEYLTKKSLTPLNGLDKYSLSDFEDFFKELEEIDINVEAISWDNLDPVERVFYDDSLQSKKDFNLIMFLKSDVFKIENIPFGFINIFTNTNDNRGTSSEHEMIKEFQEYLLKLKNENL